MVFVQVENVSKSYNEKNLFENISFGIHKGQKIALIAKNGTGKSTLLKIISGLETANTGSVVMRNDLSYDYLDQNPVFNNDDTIIEAVFSSSKIVTKVVKEYEEALVSGDNERLSNATDLMDRNNAWAYEEVVKQILSQLDINEFDKKIGTLSGGQKKRIALAAVLISEPDLLILDEPTNHLDVDMIVWLEKYLKHSNCTLLMVTHDRYFLDRVCNEIIEIDEGFLYRYKGNYSYFLEKRAERIENENTAVEKAKNHFKKELEWMRRMPLARTTKSKSRIDSFYELKKAATSRRIEKTIKLDQKETRLGKKIMEINNISKNYDGLYLLKNFSYVFKHNERIGIIGKNGSGKTTLLNILTGSVYPDSGFIDLGETVSIGYYRQEGLHFDENQRVIDIAKNIAEIVETANGNKVSAGEFLKQFLFSPEMQYTNVAKLSGGEKRRLYLMTVLMKNPNFLILDEPTNDLDIITLNILEEYLTAFKGCVIIVSHDRYFMDKIVEHLFVLEHDTPIRDFPGNYSLYMDYREAEEKKKKKVPLKANLKNKDISPKNNPKKLSYKEQKELESIELEIEKLETEKKNIETFLYNGSPNQNDIIDKSNRLGELTSLIEVKSNRWLELSMLLEE